MLEAGTDGAGGALRREYNPSDETTSYFSERVNTKPGDLLGASPPQNTNKAPAHNAGSRCIHAAPPIPTRSDRKKLFYCASEKRKGNTIATKADMFSPGSIESTGVGTRPPADRDAIY